MSSQSGGQDGPPFMPKRKRGGVSNQGLQWKCTQPAARAGVWAGHPTVSCGRVTAGMAAGSPRALPRSPAALAPCLGARGSSCCALGAHPGLRPHTTVWEHVLTGWCGG